ncbi:site-2 protease family protein [Aneurinibacillus sp. Ricciae_BoGa-3]|uniref:site-2 protease family protein n=1 Tax=Aneurinibacillus sp. Ricciae_BoGa-3 TaxID=3022697 RepID=UPI0023407094|nr:site-2 protease family protein [Aneurinibacillus sp. Ricciae_BoGa-3]WCK56013.1 site-2 protease family protein [Aneurinibacillus sp. Ricciae_BoGa-3]
MFNFDWNTLLYRVVAFVIAFSLHEWAHAFVAYRLGDDTAKNQGRLTLNPLSHVDPFGLLMILFGPFGWARPVPVNGFNLRGNRRLGMVLVAAAGPLINLVLAMLFFKVGTLLFSSTVMLTWPKWAVDLTSNMIQWCFDINVALFVFNLLPITPLDGSKILRFILPRRFDSFFDKVEPYGTFVLLLLIFLPSLGGPILYYPYYITRQLINQLLL